MFNKKIWRLVEKLYIHCYGVEKFTQFLNSHGVFLPDDFYKSFETYSYMSTEQNRFAQIMQGSVKTKRQLSVLQDIIFNEEIKRTQRDNWNYYNVYIKEWYPDLTKQLSNIGDIEINYSQKKIFYKEDEIKNIQEPDFLVCNFDDPFLDHIKKEIIETYDGGQFVATMIVSRKLIECLILRIFEVVFNKYDKSKQYDKKNHALWYNEKAGRTYDLSVLLKNLKDNASAFHEDEDFIKDICTLINPLRNEMNKITHRDYKIPTKGSVDKWGIPNIFNRLQRLYFKYCRQN